MTGRRSSRLPPFLCTSASCPAPSKGVMKCDFSEMEAVLTQAGSVTAKQILKGGNRITSRYSLLSSLSLCSVHGTPVSPTFTC